MTRTFAQPAAVVFALFMMGTACAQDPVADKIKAKAKDFFESTVELEIQGGVY
ncbi:MAG: hypothetical protein HYY17_05725, partial [Planctomycetes bacterium]|nr:hypothetical protein [Planctomycetota bacterium]